MQLADLQQRLRTLGAAPIHEQHLLRRWLRALPLAGGRHDASDFLPRTLREALPQVQRQLDGLATLASEHPAPDGSARLLLSLADGQAIEATLLPREGLCISSQVGCAVGCRFCMSGRAGLQRQLGSAEMLAQVALARRRRPVKKVVFMGIGEPSHNLDNVLDTIDALGTLGGIGHKDLVFSTVGDRRVFERLPAGRVKPALALSLHSTDVARRRDLLPRAPLLEPAELVDAADAYARATGYPAQLQWTLLDGVNDGDDEVQRLLPLLRGRRLMLNLIPFNSVEGSGFRRPPWARAVAFNRALNAGGVLTRLRRSAAQDVDGGCGQLRARSARPAPDAPPAAAAIVLHAAG
ncbi:RNA methyltransferase [Pseudorhodoferax sp.]|uniref:RNA methyltransferase n=1 Tax=Pseudorhodoferax sp. TaxID=1993553 RepID=UPI002DD61A17|nr:RNA methyltransferase [Pseudorhodoferax sp.]